MFYLRHGREGRGRGEERYLALGEIQARRLRDMERAYVGWLVCVGVENELLLMMRGDGREEKRKGEEREKERNHSVRLQK